MLCYNACISLDAILTSYYVFCVINRGLSSSNKVESFTRRLAYTVCNTTKTFLMFINFLSIFNPECHTVYFSTLTKLIQFKCLACVVLCFCMCVCLWRNRKRLKAWNSNRQMKKIDWERNVFLNELIHHQSSSLGSIVTTHTSTGRSMADSSDGRAGDCWSKDWQFNLC